MPRGRLGSGFLLVTLVLVYTFDKRTLTKVYNIKQNRHDRWDWICSSGV